MATGKRIFQKGTLEAFDGTQTTADALVLAYPDEISIQSAQTPGTNSYRTFTIESTLPADTSAHFYVGSTSSSSVSLLTTDTTAQIATKLAAATLTGYTITSSGSTVTVTANAIGNALYPIELDLGGDTTGYQMINYGGTLVGTSTLQSLGIDNESTYYLNIVVDAVGGHKDIPAPPPEGGPVFDGSQGISNTATLSEFITFWNEAGQPPLTLTGGNLKISSLTSGNDSNVQLFTPTATPGLFESITGFVSYATPVDGGVTEVSTVEYYGTSAGGGRKETGSFLLTGTPTAGTLNVYYNSATATEVTVGEGDDLADVIAAIIAAKPTGYSAGSAQAGEIDLQKNTTGTNTIPFSIDGEDVGLEATEYFYVDGVAAVGNAILLVTTPYGEYLNCYEGDTIIFGSTYDLYDGLVYTTEVWATAAVSDWWIEDEA